VAIVVWQNAPTAPIPTPSVAVQLKPAPAPAATTAPAAAATNNDVAPAAPSTTEPVPAVTKNTAKAASKAPARGTRRDAPAVVTAERGENTEPSPARDVKTPPAHAGNYEQRVNDAARIAEEDSDRGLAELQRLAADEPNRPEAYEAMAGLSLRKKDYGQARELIESALAHGGKASISIIHDHSRGNFDKGDTKATCVGDLIILANEVKFETAGDDRFSASWADVRNAGSNRFFGSGIGGFHVAINAGGKYKNFNLAPESKDKAEGKLVLDLLTAYARTDRSR
jgi:hypothetical protein